MKNIPDAARILASTSYFVSSGPLNQLEAILHSFRYSSRNFCRDTDLHET